MNLTIKNMNARQALEMNDWVINNTIGRVKRVMKVRGISYDEALNFCEEVELKHETDRSRLAGIQIRYNQIKNNNIMNVKSIKSINPKHQKMVNKVVFWNTKYEEANAQRDLAYDTTECDYEEDDKVWRKWNKVCESTFDKYLECLEMLPKGEQKNVEKQRSRCNSTILTPLC